MPIRLPSDPLVHFSGSLMTDLNRWLMQAVETINWILANMTTAGASVKLFNPAAEKTSATFNAAALAVATTDLVVTTDFSFTATDVDAMLLRLYCALPGSAGEVWTVNIGAKGYTVPDMQMVIPAEGSTFSVASNQHALVRCSSDKKITVDVACAGVPGSGTITLRCFGYVAGATWSA